MAIDQSSDSNSPNQSKSDATTPASGESAADQQKSGTSPDTDRLTLELNDAKDKFVRAYAEMDNMRRRHERERIDLSKYALENVFKELLPVLDSLEKALPDDASNAPKANGSSDERSYYDGMVMIKRQLLDIFRKQGLEVIRAQGAPFDPNLHQAIQRVESDDVKVETVGDEYACGYMLHGRLLRPAMVSVLTPSGG